MSSFPVRGALLPLLLSLAGCASTAPPPAPPPAPEILMQPGISLELARHRAATIRDVAYDLALDLSGTDRVEGAVSIYFERSAGAGDLVLDFRGPGVTSVHVNQQEVEDYRRTNGHIVIPERHLLEGRNAVDVRFTAAMAASGASVIRFVEPAPTAAADGGEPDSYLYTLLVPADANQLFPCFDQPDLKAAFRLEVIAPDGARVVSNGAESVRSPADAGQWVRFEPTAPISTYLLAVAAGPWHTWTDSTSAIPMTLFARRSLAAEVDADTLLATNRRALEWLQEYFRSPYPFGKFDFVLAPAFPFGGMEHPGAVFYNESRFIFREPPTRTDRLARDATIYHEVAHQWFGDLVTMRWFDDLWLKEGFSTYMAARMQEALDPESGAWKTFYLRNKPLAYGVDVTTGTTPVWQSLENLDLAKSNYGPIVYNKAPAILKQLEFRVGEEAFRYGLQVLLRRHAFGNIGWQDLLEVMEEASGQSLASFGEQYVLRPGIPLIETEVRTVGGRIQALRLVQRPAVALEGDSVGWWPGQVRVRLGYANREDVLLTVDFEGDTTAVAAAEGLPAPDYVLPNDGDFGYGIFLLDSASATTLLQRAGELDDPLLRTLAWGALWDLLREGRLPSESFLESVIRQLPGERDEEIVTFLLARASTALGRYLPPDDSANTAALRIRFERMLVEGMAEEGAPYDLRKAKLDALLAGARTPDALAVMEDLLSGRRLFDGEPLRQPSRWVAVQTLIAMGRAGTDSMVAAERVRDESAEAERRAFIAAAARPVAAAKAGHFRRYLDDASLNEEWVTASLGAFNHPAHAEITLPYLPEALERLPWIQQNRRIFFLPQWINAFVGGQSTREALGVVDDYLRRHPELSPDLRRKVLQARDELERTVRIREAG
jgi:aminopeptidase N